MANNIAVIEQDLIACRQQFELARTDDTISFDKEFGFAMQIISSNDYLLKVALQNRQSLVDAVVNCAAMSLTLNPAKKHAYLVPRKGKICLDISYIGMIDAAVRSGSIVWAQANVVHKGDNFKLRGYDQPPVHEHDPFSTERGEIIGAFVVAKMVTGDYLTHTMTIAMIHSTRDRSEAWKKYLQDKSKKCPWVTDEVEMIRKTVVKQASKYWPQNEKVMQISAYLNDDGEEGLDQSERFVNERPASAEPEQQFYPDDQFNTNFSKWCDVIKSGRKTVEAMITWVNQKGLHLTEKQKERLRNATHVVEA